MDLKEVGDRVVVIEINDNPNVDAGNEDGVIGDALYERVMTVFLKRVKARLETPLAHSADTTRPVSR